MWRSNASVVRSMTALNSLTRITCVSSKVPRNLQTNSFSRFTVTGSNSCRSRASFHTTRSVFASNSGSHGPLKKTPLYEFHLENGGNLVNFGGYEMPLEYKGRGTIDTAIWTRSKASIFDVSHMTQHKFTGKDAAEFLETISPSSIVKLKPFTGTYSAFLNDEAGIVDDTIITNISEQTPTFYVVTNAANYDVVKAYLEEAIKDFNKPDTLSWEIIPNTGMIAFQGPKTYQVLQSLNPLKEGKTYDLAHLSFGQSAWLSFTLSNGHQSPSILVSRTGYTGEDGFELSIPHPDPSQNSTSQFTKTLIEAGKGEVCLAGLGARDILRIEAGLCLHGNDIDANTTPQQGSIAWIIPKDRRIADAGYKGVEKLYGKDAAKAGFKRVGLQLDQQSVARPGMTVFLSGTDEELGKVTSGGPSPIIGKPIAMAKVLTKVKVGDEVDIQIRNKKRKAKVVKMPFVPTKYYKGPSS